VKTQIKGVVVSNDDKWIYDWFGMDAISPKDILNEIEAADGEDLEVEINSPGGDVYAGSEIYSSLMAYKGKVITDIVGIAASAAGLIAMAGRPTRISPTAQLMVHNAMSQPYGDYRILQQESDILKNYNISIANAYRLKTGMNQEQILEIMGKGGSYNGGSWLNAQQALELKFVDEIMFDEGKKLVASAGLTTILPPTVISKLKNHLKQIENSPINKITKAMNGVAPSDVSKKKAPEDEEWNAPTLSDFTDKSWEDLTDTEKTNIAGHFAWAAEMPPATYGDLKLPHHNTSGEIVWRGVANAAARLSQSSIPSEDIPKVQAHLGAHYKAFDKTPPWEKGETENKLTIKTGITPESEQFVAQLGKAVILLEEIKNKLSTEEKPADKSGFFDMQLSEKINQLNLRRNVK
jgi:ATP-dependent Clp protease protease subunit